MKNIFSECTFLILGVLVLISGCDPNETNPTVTAPITVISGGNVHSLGLHSDGTLWAWGHNYYGELGDGTNEDKNMPVQTDRSMKRCLGIRTFLA